MNIKLNSLIRRYVSDNIYIRLTSSITYLLRLKKYYMPWGNKKSVPKNIIYMADGKVIHGGLADRIKGMMSLYMYAESRRCPFSIYFRHPFNLEDYLQPNKVEWKIEDSFVSYSSRQSKAFLIKQSRLESEKYISSVLDRHVGLKQLHIYTNLFYKKENFCDVFHKLFKPSSFLEEQLNYNRCSLGPDYVSITYRFQQLLGDFKEDGFKILDDTKKVKLINSCLSFIEEVHNLHLDKKRILITADSVSFLDLARKKYDYVYIIPGTVNHVDYIEKSDDYAYIKSFVDFYMLTESSHVYSYSEGEMYANSEFAKLAALVGKKQFTKIRR